ncbi:LuxR C-terminal-related transcriptional regulator [Streptomyces subrutilus]|uniref:LuxR C-terminal-related transcriptional regulator n=1 Tax=Streptomyces subrutilus TaxID=36818 RepID=UPI0033C76926
MKADRGADVEGGAGAEGAEGAEGAPGWAALADTARGLLERYGRLAVSGPWGAGKTALLAELGDTGGAGPASADPSPRGTGHTGGSRTSHGSRPAPARWRRCLRLHAQDGDQDVPYAALAQLLGAGALADADHTRGAAGPDTRLRVRLALAELLTGDEGDPGQVLLLVDGAQWVDAASADVLGSCVRALPPGRLAVVAAERTAGHPAAAARLLGGHPPVVRIPAADRMETAAALQRSGLPARWAAPVHRYCGGNRALLDVGCRVPAGSAGLPEPYGPAYGEAYRMAYGSTYGGAYRPAYGPTEGEAHHPTDGGAHHPEYAEAHRPTYGPVDGEAYHPAYGPTYGEAHRPAPGPTDGEARHPAPGPTDGEARHPAPGPTDGEAHQPAYGGVGAGVHGDTAIGAAQGPGGSGLSGRRRQVRELAALWLATVPAEVRTTLQVAALAHRPDADLLRRAGCPQAEDHLELAVRAGLLTPDDASGPHDTAPARTRFAAGALAEAAVAAATAGERRRIHGALADAVHDPVRRARHRALARDTADQAAAEDTAQAAAVARGAGERHLAAELMLLAARLTPVNRPALRLDRLADAARDAAAAGSAELAQQAAALIAEGRGSPAQQVHALLAVADAQGQDFARTEALLVTARRTAAGDPALLAAVELRSSVQANVASGDAALALRHADAATVLARECGDAPLEAAALTMAARMERVLGRLETAPVTLAAALALAVPPPRIGIRNSPEYLAARHAVFDGRLARARRTLTDLLPAAQASGEAEDLVDIWRSLAEVDCGLGACSEALRWAALAVDLTATAGLSPGPAWYTAALAHSHGGSFAQALRYAAQGLRASREEHDALHTTRSLWILGAVHLHHGHVEQAATALAEVDALEAHAGAADPAVLRWQGDAVEAFAASGRTVAAHALLDRMQESVGPHGGHASLRAALTRARAVCLHLEGENDEAVELLDDAAHAFAVLGRPVEEGRTRLARGRVERRRRRAAAARTAWETARTVFEEAGAAPWAALTDDHLSHLTGQTPAPGTPARGRAAPELTEQELRLAALVCAGATNLEAAQQMFISTKTVESTLSRIYRKLGVRNRTQLTATFTR